MRAFPQDSLEHLLAASLIESIGSVALGSRVALSIELLRRKGHTLHAQLSTETHLRAVLGVPAPGTSLKTAQNVEKCKQLQTSTRICVNKIKREIWKQTK